jgi:hypothetical protein
MANPLRIAASAPPPAAHSDQKTNGFTEILNSSKLRQFGVPLAMGLLGVLAEGEFRNFDGSNRSTWVARHLEKEAKTRANAEQVTKMVIQNMKV